MLTVIAHPLVALGRISVVALLATGCSSSPDMEKELTTVRSWTATARLATEDAQRGAISRRMAAQLRARAAEARRDAGASLAAAARSADELRHAEAALDSLDAAVRALDTRVGAR